MAPAPDAPDPREGVVVPPLLLWAARVVLGVGVVMTVAGATRVGISFDEPYHVLRLQNWFDHGWYLLDEDLTGGGELGSWTHDPFVYAPVTALLLHAANVLLGQETWGTVTAGQDAYLVRHLGVALVGLIGVAGTFAVARMLFRSASWGVVAAAVLVAMPMWTGHSMFNVKDVPTATGYTLVTAGMMWLSREAAGTWRARAANVAVVWAGVWLGLGTRPGLWPGLAAAAVLLVIFEVTTTTDGRWRLRDLTVGIAVPLTGLALLYPQVFANPSWPWRSVTSSIQYAESPGYWWYVPSQVVATMPLLLLVVALGGWLAALADRSWLAASGRRGRLLLILVAAQGLLLPAVAMVGESHLDTGLRQLLFAAPAVAVLLTVGLRAAVVDARRSGRRHTYVLVAALSSAAVVAPTLTQVGFFPYNYAYASIIVDAKNLEPLNDSWRLSTRELAAHIPPDEFVVCSPTVDESGVARRYMGLAGRIPVERSQDCRTDRISPIAAYTDHGPAPADEVEPTFLALRTGATRLGANCTELADVERYRHFRKVELSALARCTLVLHDYPSEGIHFGATDPSVVYLMGGWTGHPQSAGVATIDSSGSFGFTLPAQLRGTEVALRLQLTAPQGGRVLVNNREVARLVSGKDRHRVRVPAAAASALGAGRMVVTVRGAGTDPVRLHSAVLGGVS